MAPWCSLLVVATATAASHAHLAVQARRCGDHQCPADRYCDPFDSHCRPCAHVCDAASNNYDGSVCGEQCQVPSTDDQPTGNVGLSHHAGSSNVAVDRDRYLGYIHDQLYAHRDSESSLSSKIQQLTTLAAASLVVLCVLLAVVVGYVLARVVGGSDLLQGLRGVKGREKSDNNNGFDVETPKMSYKSDGLRLDMQAAQAVQAAVPEPSRSTSPCHEAVTPATTSTPLSRPRHPSEDTTLEYAYDNPGMERDGRKESSF